MGINVIIVLYNTNVVGFIAVTDYPVYARIICFGRHRFLDRVKSFSLFSASSIKHQVASVILHVRTGLPPLRRLASGLSPVNNTTTATAVVMTATATRLRIVQPLLKCSKICENDRKIRLCAHRKTMNCTSPLSTGPTE
jgi:hypothetical protein